MNDMNALGNNAMSTSSPLVWALLGERTGDNNQVLALAEELGLPFEKIWQIGRQKIFDGILDRLDTDAS